jgi:hypothetical protein
MGRQMEHSSKNLRWREGVSQDEMWQEIEEAFSEPLFPSQPSLAADFKDIRPPATDEDIARLQAVWGDTLPVSYLDFLRESDGAAGCVNDYDGDYLTLWGSGELVERNASLPIGRTSPGLLAIGTDGRSGWVGLERVKSQDSECCPVVRCDSGGSGPANLRQLAPDFREWRKGGFQLRPGGFICGGGG